MGDKFQPSLRKQQSLTNVTLIDQIFKSSLSIKAFPLIFSYNFLENKPVIPVPLQILISVPKRKFKKAVDRNRIKRLIRESFRLKKALFIEALQGKPAYGALIYTNKEMPDFQSIDKSISKIIVKLHENNRD